MRGESGAEIPSGCSADTNHGVAGVGEGRALRPFKFLPKAMRLM